MKEEGDAPAAKRTTSSDLLFAVQVGDDAAFRELHRRYGPRLRGWIRRLIRHPDLVQEALQETWMRLLKATPKVPHRFAAFALKVATHTALTLLRREGRFRSKLLGDSPSLSACDPGVESDVLDQLILAERRARVWSLAGEVLSGKQREVFLLRERDGLTDSEICRRLGLSSIDQRVSLFRARQRIKRVAGEMLRARSE